MVKTFSILQSEKLILRQLTMDDLVHVYDGLSHPDVIKHYGISFDSLEGSKEQMEWFANLEKEEKGIWWAVTSHDGMFYGAGGFHDWHPINRCAELGFWLLPDHWGKGLMQEAMQLILEYAFGPMNLNRIYGYVESENENCRRAMKRLNFTQEGIMKSCEWKDGRFIDLDIWAKIND